MARSLKSFKQSDRKSVAIARTGPNAPKGLGYWGSFDYLHRIKQAEQAAK